MIEWIKYIILGLVQGIAEVLPISSSAHLIIAGELVGTDNNIAFEVFLHIASLIAVCVYLRKTLWKLIKGFFGYIFKRKEEYKGDFKYCLYVILSTLVVVVFTLLFEDYVDFAANTLWIIGLALVVNGILLFILSQVKGFRKVDEINYKDALTVGLFQCLGIFPGISRSGSCLCGSFARKIDKETAAEYAFILFVPAMLGATVLKFTHIADMIVDGSMMGYYIISFIITLFTTYFAFKFLLTIIRKGKLHYFGYYCLAVGASVFIYDILR